MPPGADLVFKSATVDDVDLLLTLMEALYKHEQHPFDRDQTRKATHNLLHSPEFGQIWLMQQEEIQVGYLVLTFGFSLEFGGRDALLDELFILEPYRSRGFGRQALEWVFAQCRAKSIRALHLEVLDGNDTAAAIYRRFGFQQDTRKLMTKWLE